MPLSEQKLKKLYIQKKKSSADICRLFKCSEHKVNYWLAQYGVQKRSISEAIYVKHNPGGDPFKCHKPKTIQEAVLYGLGLGLFWGEGTKTNRYAIRLGNTDPTLIKKFIEFLVKSYGIKKKKLRLGLQVFSDMSARQVLKFWQKELRIPTRQFQKVIITPAKSIGTYRHKTKCGVLTVQYHNKKLRKIIGDEIARVAQSAEQRNGNA